MGIKVKAVYKGDSRKRTYHVYNLGTYGDLFTGMLYVSTDVHSVPKEFDVEVQLDMNQLFPSNVRKLSNQNQK